MGGVQPWNYLPHPLETALCQQITARPRFFSQIIVRADLNGGSGGIFGFLSASR